MIYAPTQLKMPLNDVIAFVNKLEVGQPLVTKYCMFELILLYVNKFCMFGVSFSVCVELKI